MDISFDVTPRRLEISSIGNPDPEIVPDGFDIELTMTLRVKSDSLKSGFDNLRKFTEGYTIPNRLNRAINEEAKVWGIGS